MDKYAMYLRKSRADVEAEKLGDGETLSRHKKILTELASRKGLFVERIYQEIVSGETISARPAIQELIQDCYAGKYKGILIVEVTRLSRGNQGDAQTILDCLKYSNRNDGVLVITPTKTYDVSHSQEDEEFMEFELFMSRREYKMIQKRMDRGRKQAVVEGNFMASRRPYGYNIVKTKRNRTLEPNPEEAKYVKLIYDWSAEDQMTPFEIASRLNTMGVESPNGGYNWSRETVHDLICNPVYYGKVRWNSRMTVKTMKDGELVSSRPRSNSSDKYMLYDGKHLAIVSEELFKAANSRFCSDKTRPEYKMHNPLAGLLRCKKCGTVMNHMSMENLKRPAPRFVHRSIPSKCTIKSIKEEPLMKALIEALKQHLDDFEVKLESEPVNNNDEISSLENELSKTEKKLRKLFDAWEDGLIDTNEFAERKSIHHDRIENIKAELMRLKNEASNKKDYGEIVSSLHLALDALQDPTVDAEYKNKYLKSIIKRIDYFHDGNDFELEVLFL